MAKVFAKIKKGVSFTPGLSGPPADIEDGDIYYDSTLAKFRQKANGTVSDLGGSAVGDITNIEARLQSRFQISSWRAMTPNVIASDGATKVFSSTGVLETQDYLLNAGQNLISTGLLDAEFLAASVIPLSAEVQVCYDLTAVDPNPTIQLSRDGGTTLQTVTVSKNSGDDSWKGSIVFSNTEPGGTLDTYSVANADTNVELNTTSTQALSQSVIFAVTNVYQSVTIYLNKLGSPTGNFIASIVKDDGTNKPSTSKGDYYFSSAPQSIAALASGNNTVVITLPNQIALPAGTYHLVIETDSTYKASFSTGVTSLSYRVDNSAPTAPGVSNLFNGTSWSVGTADGTYIVSGFALDMRFKVTSSAAATKLKGYGVFYDKGVDQTVGRSNRFELAFDGATNPNTFDLTNSGFIPDDKLLIVIWANTGQVFVHPVFDVNGHSVVFAAGQFSSTGTQRLIFWQPLGSSFDNNEKNAALLAANFLGSTQTSIDRSVAGRGIVLRASDGLLYEAVIKPGGAGWDFFLVT